MKEAELLEAFKIDLLDRYEDLRIEKANDNNRDLQLFEVRHQNGSETCQHVVNIRVDFPNMTAEPGYYRTGLPHTEPIKMDLNDPESLQQLYDFIEKVDGHGTLR